MVSASQLSRADILAAFGELDRAFAERGVIGELCLFGGAVMVLAFQARLSTKDVDAVFQPSAVVREVAAEVGERRGWPAGWLNDGVKEFVSVRHEVSSGPLPQFPHLRLTMPSAGSSACSVNATAGSPSSTARAQVAAMSPSVVSKENWVCTCPSVGSAAGGAERPGRSDDVASGVAAGVTRPR